MSASARNSLKLSLLTIGSRVLGLFRDHYQAVFFGTGPIAFAWEIAIILPGVIRNLLVEGSISQAFIPLYTQTLEHSKKEAAKVAGIILSFVFFLMLACTALVALASPYILPLITKQSLVEADFMIRLSWILILFMVPASLTAIIAGIANAHQHFVFPALSPIILNISLLLAFLIMDENDYATLNAKTLAWFFIFSAVFQLGIQYFYLCHQGLKPRLSLNFTHPSIKQVFVLMLPAILSTAIFQINQLVDIAIASYFIGSESGGVPALRFAQRLILLPTGIVGVALATTMLPILSRSITKGSEDKEKEIMNSIHFAIFLTLPACFGFYFIGKDIITLLFHGGEWDSYSTQITWEAMRFYLLAIPIYSLNKIFVAIFFAFKDTKTTLRAMLISTSANLVLNLVLVQSMQHAGIALSTAISAFIYFLQMLFLLQKKHITLNAKLFYEFIKTNLHISLALILFLLFIDGYGSILLHRLGNYLALIFELESKLRLQASLKVFVATIGGFILYISLAKFSKTKEIQIIQSLFNKIGRH